MSEQILRATAPIIPLLTDPQLDAKRDDELHFGHGFIMREIIERMDGEFGFGQIINMDGKPGNEGYIFSPRENLREPESGPTHRIDVMGAPLFAWSDVKAHIVGILPFAALIDVQEIKEDYARCHGGWVSRKHIAPLNMLRKDWVATAEAFLGLPYIWGGRSSQGLDCSGLVHIALSASGISSPRDSGPQSKALGHELDLHHRSNLRRGDLIFWKGHVGIMADKDTLLHANAFHMKTATEPLDEAEDRIAKSAGPVTVIRRL